MAARIATQDKPPGGGAAQRSAPPAAPITTPSLLLRPHLDLGAASTRQVDVLHVDELERPLVAGEVDDAAAVALVERVLEAGVPRRALAELDVEVDELEVAVEHDDRELLELALVAADVDPVVVEPAVHGALTEQLPAGRVPLPRRGIRGLPRPHLDLRRAAARDVAVLEIDLADHALVAGQVDHARAGVLAEVVRDLRVELLAVAERDLEVEQLELALLDDQRQLGELA